MKVLFGVFYLGVFCLVMSCKKDKVSVICPEVNQASSRWEKIAGVYDVYDTTGVYLYELKLTPIYKEDGIIDSLRFENFDGEFNFTARQMYPDPDNFPNYIRIGGHDTLYDSNDKRWKIYSGLFDDYNSFINDTIRLRFQKTNINYWVEDVVPYYHCICKQIAEKQH